MMNDSAKNKLIIALDMDSVQKARDLSESLREYAGMFKIGRYVDVTHVNSCQTGILQFKPDNFRQFLADRLRYALCSMWVHLPVGVSAPELGEIL